MPVKVALSEIIDALDMQLDDFSSFVDPGTGQVDTISDALLEDAEKSDGQEPDLPEWQKEEWALARRIAASGRFLRLPTKFDVNERGIMREFSSSAQSARIREDLLRAVSGPRPFRNFKDAVRRHGMESSWFAFRSEALKRIAIEWCQENQLAWK